MNKTVFIILATLGCSMVPVGAQESGRGMGAYVTGGTVGAGLGLSYRAAERCTLRGEWTHYSLTRTFSDNSIDYRAQVTLQSGAVYADYRPFAGGFRFTGGVSFLGPKADAEGQAVGGVFTINGHDYDATGESIKGTVKYPSVMPYLGLGWGYRPAGGLMVGLDLGAFLGKPKASLTYSQGILDVASAADLAAEEQQFRDKVERVKVFPVLKLGVGYSF